MALVTLSIGSNIEHRRNIAACLDALLEAFGELSVSRVYESQPVGLIQGQTSANFYNLVVALESDWPIERLQCHLKALERKQGRQQNSLNQQGPLVQPLDVDVLTVGGLTGVHGGVELPRKDILRHAFVLRPLAELLPAQRHPLNQRRYDELWDGLDAESQPLWPIEFSWRRTLPYNSKA